MPMILLASVLILIVWLIPGSIGGMVTAFTLRWADAGLDATRLVIIAFGWTIGMVVGGVIHIVMNFALLSVNLSDELASIIALGMTGMIIGLIGSWTTFKVLESSPRND